uniref:Rap guanine nucleotide exchange factor 3-like n=1 Tax=Sinocyclocheilus anshuiensis TaxID=1608454 RepID=A0A671N111_9TELE
MQWSCENSTVDVAFLRTEKTGQPIPHGSEANYITVTDRPGQGPPRRGKRHRPQQQPQQIKLQNEKIMTIRMFITFFSISLHQFLSDRILKAARVVYSTLMERNPGLIRDRKHHLKTYRQCCSGKDLVDWLMKLNDCFQSRSQAVGMWQVLVDEGILSHVKQELNFHDKDTQFYRFMEAEFDLNHTTNDKDSKDEELQESLSLLIQMGPDALLTMILRKCPSQRTPEDLEVIYEELLHVKAVAHLSTSVRKELAAVLVFESHAKAGTVLFSQGDKGTSWYIIWRGSVNVITHGKGLVTTLHEGEDFGQLALVNDAPRSATIILREDNCHFLRVDKQDFIRILKDVEANTVRLEEHGKVVLVLEKSSAQETLDMNYSPLRYTVMSGTPEKILEHMLETIKLETNVFMPKGSKDNPVASEFLEVKIESNCPFAVLYEIFKPDHKAVTVMLSVDASVNDILTTLVDPERDYTPVKEQLGPEKSTMDTLEQMCSKDMASQHTSYDWELFMAMHEVELVYYVFGREKFPGATTANLERFVRRFNEVQYWVVTELFLCEDLVKRAILLKKFIKMAVVLKEQKNLNSFFAVMFGLSNSAVQRLNKTWERLPNKTKRIYCAYERLMDPSRNHRAYRLTVAKLSPPYIPFMPLLLKDMTFIHEGNKNYTDKLVNFEKMRMIARTVKTVRECRSQPYGMASPTLISLSYLADSDQSLTLRNAANIRQYIQNLKVIDNQKKLTQQSRAIER